MTRVFLFLALAVLTGCTGASQERMTPGDSTASPGTMATSPSPEVVEALGRFCGHVSAFTRLSFTTALGKAAERLKRLEAKFDSDSAALASLGEESTAALAADFARWADYERRQVKRVDAWSDVGAPPGFGQTVKELVAVCGA